MLERVHEHIVRELRQSARTDTIFVVAAVIFHLTVLAVNWAMASESLEDDAELVTDLVMWALCIVSVVIDGISLTALWAGWGTRSKLLAGALSMYRDRNVAKYYDPSLPSHYRRRYLLFAGAIVCISLTAISVPLLVRYLS